MPERLLFQQKISPRASILLEALYLAGVGFCCFLAKRGWKATSSCTIVFLGLLYMCKIAIALPRDNGWTALRTVMVVGRLGVLFLSVLTINAAQHGYNYSMINDPHAAISGVGVSDLKRQVQLRPDAYDVVLDDGYVEVQWAGRYRETHCSKDGCYTWSVSAAPVYANKRNVGGKPYAWAIGRETVPPVYCGQRGGLCGLYLGTLVGHNASGYETQTALRAAAEDAAQLGHFPYEEGVPMVRMVDLVASSQRSLWWWKRFWPWIATCTVLALAANVDSAEAALGCERSGSRPAEQRPLIQRAAV